MPHIIFEFSQDLVDNFDSISEIIKKIMPNIENGNFDISQCKFRYISYKIYKIGNLDESKSSFIHISIKILKGRSLEVKKELSSKISEALINEIKTAKFLDISIDIIEMDKDTYFKKQINS